MQLKLHNKDDDQRDHIVPLSRQFVETINAIHHLTGAGPFVLPNPAHGIVLGSSAAGFNAETFLRSGVIDLAMRSAGRL